MEGGRKMIVYADGKEIGEFKWSQRKSHSSLFNLSGVEIRDAETGELMSRIKLRAEYQKDMKRGR